MKEIITRPDGTSTEIYLDGYLRENFVHAKDIIKKDWDMMICVDGYEGSGKSVLAQQLAFFCDSSFCMERIAFSPTQFSKAIKTAKEYQAVVYDEAFTGLNSRGSMGLINRTLVKMLAEIRQKNLFVFIVMPTFFDLDRYVALWRSRALIHVYLGDGYERGFFEFYNIEKKKNLYVNGKKYYQYNNPEPNFRGRFSNTYVVDEADYRKKKKHSLDKNEEAQEQKLVEINVQQRLFDALVNRTDITNVQKADILGMSVQSYYYRVNKKNDLAEVEGI